MCFSASASFTAAAVVGGFGAATLPMVRDRRQLMFASLPLAFGAHQFVEGVVWQQMEQTGEVGLRSPAVSIWLVFAWLLLPIWVPVSVSWFEPDARRRRWMRWLAVLGAATGIYLFATSVVDAATVIVSAHRLQYQLPYHPGWLLALPYVAATCLPLLLSSHRFVNWFGVAMVVSMGVSTMIAARQFSSVWCFFAAMLSLGLLAYYALDRFNSRALMPDPA